ncbi:hypothetical protein HaLaN_26982, partial [Haematococcus lacustris]
YHHSICCSQDQVEGAAGRTSVVTRSDRSGLQAGG